MRSYYSATLLRDTQIIHNFANILQEGLTFSHFHYELENLQEFLVA